MNSREILKEQILSLLPNGNYVTLVAINGLGKEYFIKELTQQNQITNPDNKVVLIKSSALLDISESSFYKLLLDTLSEELEIPLDGDLKVTSRDELYKLLRNSRKLIEQYLSDQSKTLTIIVTHLERYDSLPSSFFHSLGNLREVDKDRFSYIFTGNVDLLSRLKKQAIGEFYDKLVARLIWLPLPDRELFESLCDHCGKKFGYEVSKELRDEIFAKTNGHSGMSKYLIQMAQEMGPENIKLAVEYTPVISRIESILEELSEKQRELLTQIAGAGRYKSKGGPAETHLIQSYIVSSKEGILEVNIPIVAEYLKLNRHDTGKVEEAKSDVVPQKTPAANPNRFYVDDGTIYIDGESYDEQLSEREFELLSLFVQKVNKVVSRDDVADILWKSQSVKKYSDWAIDQTISRLRKKLPDTVVIKTVKGRGFKLQQN